MYVECKIEYELIEDEYKRIDNVECKTKMLKLWLVCGKMRIPLSYALVKLLEPSLSIIAYGTNAVFIEETCSDGTKVKYYEEVK